MWSELGKSCLLPSCLPDRPFPVWSSASPAALGSGPPFPGMPCPLSWAVLVPLLAALQAPPVLEGCPSGAAPRGRVGNGVTVPTSKSWGSADSQRAPLLGNADVKLNAAVRNPGTAGGVSGRVPSRQETHLLLSRPDNPSPGKKNTTLPTLLPSEPSSTSLGARVPQATPGGRPTPPPRPTYCGWVGLP